MSKSRLFRLNRQITDIGEACKIIDQLEHKLELQSSEGATIRVLVDEQAKDEGLWFAAQSAAEAYVQAELRRLHEVIEGKSGEAIARDLASTQQEKP